MKHVKAQSEIMGLAIIMILIALGILFAIVFFSGSSEKSFIQVTEHELVSNTLNSILQTTTDCKGQTVESLIEDCEGIERFECNSKSSCDYVKDLIEDMFKNTLDFWKRDYYFQIKDSQNLRDFKLGNKCTGEQTSATSFIKLYSGPTITAKLDLCR